MAQTGITAGSPCAEKTDVEKGYGRSWQRHYIDKPQGAKGSATLQETKVPLSAILLSAALVRGDLSGFECAAPPPAPALMHPVLS